MKRKREDERENEERDRDETKWKKKIFWKKVSETPNPPDELAQNASKKNPFRMNYFFFFFLGKFRIWPFFNYLHDSNSIFRAGRIIQNGFSGAQYWNRTQSSKMGLCIIGRRIAKTNGWTDERESNHLEDWWKISQCTSWTPIFWDCGRIHQSTGRIRTISGSVQGKRKHHRNPTRLRLRTKIQTTRWGRRWSSEAI